MMNIIIFFRRDPIQDVVEAVVVVQTWCSLVMWPAKASDGWQCLLGFHPCHCVLLLLGKSSPPSKPLMFVPSRRDLDKLQCHRTMGMPTLNTDQSDVVQS